jgi:chemotaxis protein CheX
MCELERAIVEVVHSVCTAILELDVAEIAAPPAPMRANLAGWVEISGAWSATVVLRCDEGFAQACAAIMLGEDDCGDDATRDALGELTNMVAGNLKSLLPAPSRLSLPSVVGDGEPPPPERSGAAEHVHFQAPSGHRFEVVMTCDPSSPSSGTRDRRDPADPPG